MIINLGFYKRRADLTHQQFASHWTGIHGPLIRSIPDIGSYLFRYVQHHIVPELGHDVPSSMEFDGFSEAWFYSVEARDALFALPFFQKEVIEDEARFIDMAATRLYLMDEQRTIIRGIDETAAEWPLPSGAWR